MNQVLVPHSAAERGGLQPVVDLTANGSIRAEVGVNQPVTLAARIEMPPAAGKIVQYAWYLGTADAKFEPTTKLDKPPTRFDLKRTVRFAAPGEYAITLRVNGERSGLTDLDGTTLLQNIGRVRVVVR